MKHTTKCERCGDNHLTVPAAGWLRCTGCGRVWVSDSSKVRENGTARKRTQTAKLSSHSLAQAILLQPDVRMTSSWTFAYNGGSVKLKFEIIKEPAFDS